MRRMTDLPSNLVSLARVALLAAGWAIALGGFLYISVRVLTAVLPTTRIALTFTSESKEDITKAVVGRAKDLLQPTALDGFTEIHVPRQSVDFTPFTDDAVDALGKVEIKGVDVSWLLKTFYGFTEPRMPHVQAAVQADASVHVTWLDVDGHPARTWTTRAAEQATKPDPSSREEAIDRVVYRILYYANPDVIRRRNRAMDQISFPNANAFEAYQLGRQFLTAYQADLDPSQLDRAEERLRFLRGEMPSFPDGLLLLGITLTEQRKEDEAIQVFLQLKDLRSQGSSKDQLRTFNARLLEATARRKLYRVTENNRSVQILQDLLGDLAAALKTGPATDEKKTPQGAALTPSDLQRLELSVWCELVSALGHYQVLLRAEDFDKQLQQAPKEVAASESEQELLRGAGDKQDERYKAFLQVRARLFSLQDTAYLHAEGLLNQLGKDLEEKEAAVIASRLDNANGYARFRYAQELDEDAFQVEAKTAEKRLRTADASHPNDYMVLQNLATLLLEARYDPEGRNLVEAMELLQRSLKIKPRDYWGYEQLASAYARKADLFGLDALNDKDLDAAIAAVEKAREYRPTGWSALPILAELYVLKWEQAPGKREDLESTIATVLASSESRNPSSYRTPLVEARFAMAQARTATSQDAFDAAIGRAFRATRAVLVGLRGTPPTVEAKRIRQEASNAEDLLHTTRYDARRGLRWPR